MIKRIARLGLVLVLAVCAVVLAQRLPRGVETGLYGLADSGEADVLRGIASGLAGQGRVLLARTDGDLEQLSARAAEIRARLKQPPKVDYKETLAYLDGHKAGLLAPATRAQLAAGDFAAVADGAAARLFGLAPPLFSVKRDPFLLGTDYALALESNLADGWSLEAGDPVCEKDGATYLLVTLGLTHVPQADIVAFLAACEAEMRDEKAPCKIWCCGPPFHAARATLQAKREINLLSAVSLFFVVLFGWLLFRSVRFMPQLLLTQGAGFLAATGALFAAFPRPHVLTFVFGTSLIGLSVDYVYHARAAGGARKILKPFAYSLLTTVACFAPLLFAEVVVLRQMALFTIAGLVAVAWCVMAGPEVGGLPVAARPVRAGENGRRRGGKLLVVCASVLFVLLGLGLGRVRVVEDPAAFYRPEVYLAASERQLATVSPVPSSRFVFVPGATLQEALEKEEEVGVQGGLSAVIPSLKRQRENAALIAALAQAEGGNYTARTKIRMPVDNTDRFLDPAELPEGPLKMMVRTMHIAGGLVSPFRGDDAEWARLGARTDVKLLEPQVLLQGLFRRFTQATWKLLAVSFGAFVVLLVCFFRTACLRYAGPVLGALLASAGLLGWLHVPVTFFTLLCFFVLMGLGIDYTIFHLGDPAPETRRVVFFAFLTSFVGLGMLAFTQFPVTHGMGVAFAAGLFFAYVFSFAGALGRKVEGDGACDRAAASAGAWHAQREQSAGRVRLAIMWFAYRYLGKGFMKLLCIPVVAFIFPFAAPARKALGAFYRILDGRPPSTGRLFRHLLGFAWSLADKTDACALKKNLPAMTVRDDADWRAFQACLEANQGAFLISTHVGTIEVLPALKPGGRIPHVHAFQQMGHDAAFTRVFMKHFDASALTLHAVEAIGVETAVEMQAAIRRGDLVLMAGDRVSAGSRKTLTHDFLGRSCAWPKGVFAFARLMEAPIFFVTCVRTGWNAYTVRVKRFVAEDAGTVKIPELLDRYVAFLAEETRAHPEQWYQFYDFFGTNTQEG